MKLYVASSWRNKEQPEIVKALRGAGHEVYDFRNPLPGNEGFHWSEIDQNWRNWSVEEYAGALNHPIADSGFNLDWKAMQWADAGVLVLPSGRSAHLEAGYFVGANKPLVIYIPYSDPFEPELMYKMTPHIAHDIAGIIQQLFNYEIP